MPNGRIGWTVQRIDLSEGVTGGDGNYTYSAAGLPDGFTLNSTTGVIGGSRIEAAPASSATITVTDGEGHMASIVISIGEITE